MSQQYYTNIWSEAHAELNRIVRIERPKKPPLPDKDRKSCFEMLSLRYVKYVGIYKLLKQCYDHMVHPQKRILIAKCLEGVTGRLVELRSEVVRVDLSEYSFMGHLCADLKMIPADLELQLSKSMVLNRVAALRQRANLLDYILAGMGLEEEEPQGGAVYTVTEAVLLLQRNQRAFQGRKRKKQVRLQKKGLFKLNAPFVNLKLVNAAAMTKFQAMWRGLLARRQLDSKRKEAAVFLGMMHPPITRNLKVMEDQQVSTKFKEARENDDIYKRDLILTTERMQETDGPEMAANMKREIMQWLLECRAITGQFPQYPDEDDGGSAILFSKKSVEDVEEEMEQLQEMMQKASKKGGNKSTKPKENGKKKDEKKEKKMVPEGFLMRPSKFIDTVLVESALEYGRLWWNRDETDNRKQWYDRHFLLENVTANVELVVRLQVDELMRQELQRMQMAIDRQKSANPKKKKKKGAKKKKKKKKKGLKDLTAGTPMEDLFMELVMAGVIKKVPNSPISDFIGEYNLLDSSDAETIECTHDLGDVRKMVFDFGILPMSSSGVRTLAPCHKSLIVVGPHGSGKKMLVQSIAHELGANLFDLSAENLVDKYEDKEEQKMLIHLVMKVGKEMEPSVIFVGDCDRMFTKKLSPDLAYMRPGRLKKDLARAMKFVGPEDRILLVGTSKEPFKAAVGPLFKMYQQLIFINPPSHASRYVLWERFITDSKGVIGNYFDLSALAHVSRGFTAGDIASATREVLTENRIRRQHKDPIRTEEFVERISTFDPVFNAELQAYSTWLLKTPLVKKRNLMDQLEGEGVEIMALL